MKNCSMFCRYIVSHFIIVQVIKVKVWIFDIARLREKTREQQRFTILEVAVDWRDRGAICSHSLPAIAEKWTRGAARQTYHRPNQPQ